MKHRFAFQITGAVEGDTMDEAFRALSAYCDPANDDVPDFEEITPIKAIQFKWRDAPVHTLEEAEALFAP